MNSVLSNICPINFGWFSILNRLSRSISGSPILLIAGFFFFSASCFAGSLNEKAFQQRADEIEKIRFTDPVLANAQFRALLANSHGIPNELVGAVWGELAVTYAVMNKMDSGILAIRKSVTMLPNGINKALGVKNLGNMYLLSNDYRRADSAYSEALRINRTNGDSLTTSIILGELANMYAFRFDFENCIRLLIQAIAIHDKYAAKEVTTGQILKEKLAATYLQTKNYEFAVKIYCELLPQIVEKKDDYRYGKTLHSLSEAYLLQGNSTAADSVLRIAIRIFERLQNDELLGKSLSLQAKCALQHGNFRLGVSLAKRGFDLLEPTSSHYLSEAVTIYLELLNRTGNTSKGLEIIHMTSLQKKIAESSNKGLLDFKRAALSILMKANDKEAIIREQREILRLTDSVYDENSRRNVLEMQAKYQLQFKDQEQKLLQKQNQMLVKENSIKTKNQYLMVAVLAIGLFAGLYFYSRQRNKQMTLKHKNQINEESNRYLAEQAKWQEKDKKLKEEIIRQQREELLRVSDEMNRLQLIQKSMLSQLQDGTKMQLTEQLQLLKSDRKYLNLFMAKFNTLFPGFTTALIKRYPSLTNADLLFCALVRMNLSYKEISSILSLELTSIYKKKYRITEKMQLPDNDDFEQTILNTKM